MFDDEMQSMDEDTVGNDAMIDDDGGDDTGDDSMDEDMDDESEE